MSLPQVFNKTKCSDIEGTERTSYCLYYVLYFFYIVILMLTSRFFWGKALIVTIHYKIFVFRTMITYKFCDNSKSIRIVLSFTEGQIMPAFVLKPYFWTKLALSGLCWFSAPNFTPHKQGRWDPSLIQWEFLVKEVLACSMETSIQTHTNKSYSLIWFILCYRH